MRVVEKTPERLVLREQRSRLFVVFGLFALVWTIGMTLAAATVPVPAPVRDGIDAMAVFGGFFFGMLAAYGSPATFTFDRAHDRFAVSDGRLLRFSGEARLSEIQEVVLTVDTVWDVEGRPSVVHSLAFVFAETLPATWVASGGRSALAFSASEVRTWLGLSSVLPEISKTQLFQRFFPAPIDSPAEALSAMRSIGERARVEASSGAATVAALLRRRGEAKRIGTHLGFAGCMGSFAVMLFALRAFTETPAMLRGVAWLLSCASALFVLAALRAWRRSRA